MSRRLEALDRSIRPLLTVLITLIFNGGAIALAVTGKITAQEFLTTIGPTNGLVIGFWFGERSQQQQFQVRPDKKE